ncbi:MAG: ATP-binding protein [Burkholderiales bacterium]
MALVWAHTGLAVRVAISSGALLVLFGLLLIASLIREDIAQARRAVASDLQHELTLLATTLIEPAVVGDYTLIRQMLTVRAKHSDVRRIAWTDNSGHVIEALGDEISAIAPAWFTRLANVPDIDGEQKILVGGEPYGKISIRLTAAASIHAIWSAAIKRVMLVAGGIGICLALTSWVLFRGLRPFSELALAARRFGRGEHGLRIAVTGPPESRSCIDAFNRMGADIERLFDSLKTAESNLQRANVELEERVVLRTAELEQANQGLQAEVSERRLAEAALRVSEEYASRLARVVEQASDGILTRDMNGVITSWNAANARLFGFSAEEAIHQPIGTLHQVNFTPEERAWALARIRSGIAHTFESTRPDRDGRPIHLHVVASPIFDTEGVQCGEMSVFRDVTDRKRVEEEAARAREAAEVANRSKSQFLANMSHEIRTPMNGVLGMAELLLGTELDTNQEKFALAIHRSGTALLHLINDILDFSKIEAGRLELERLPFDLRELVCDTTELLHESAHAKELPLTFAIDEDLPAILIGDPLRLRQILTNLVGNALKFTAAGNVSIHVSKVPDDTLLQSVEHGTPEASPIGLLFAVRDTGIGIAAHAMDRLFTLFSQADGSTTRRFGGSGLGLAISKQLAESMGGKIGVESAVGLGSNFWFTVQMEVDMTARAMANDTSRRATFSSAAMIDAPAYQTISAHAGRRMAHGSSLADAPTVTERRRILLAEDNPINRQIATVMLEGFGFEVVSAVDGRQAVERSYGQIFDLILMDCQMPELDGFEATTAIRAREGAQGGAAADATPGSRVPRRTPIIAVTANAMQGDRERCLEAGMDDYLPKPFSKKNLRATVDRWIPAVKEAMELASNS